MRRQKAGTDRGRRPRGWRRQMPSGLGCRL